FDLHVEVPRVPFEEPSGAAARGETAHLRGVVAAARVRQLERAGRLNARLSDAELWRCVRAEAAALRLLRLTVSRWQLSMRSSVRAMKVARTIADLGGRDTVTAADVGEALQLRVLDRPVAA